MVRRLTAPLLLSLLLGAATAVAADESSQLLLKTFPPQAELYEGGERLEPVEQVERPDGALWRRYELRAGYQVLALRADGYAPKWLHIRGNGELVVDEKLERAQVPLLRQGEIATGNQPKGVAFAPDGRTLVVTGLRDTGIDLYRSDPLEHLRHIPLPPEGGEATGFVEALFLKEKRELWVTQMLTAEVHILSSVDYRYIGAVPTGGKWPKVMVSDPAERYLYVSNWSEKNIGVVDIENRRLIETIPVSGVPRGMAITPDGRTLFVALFEGGDLVRIDLTSLGYPRRRIEIGDGALRHIVMSKDGRRLYISDMYYGSVLVFDVDSEKVLRRRRLGYNLNTLELTPSEEYLLVSERGRNNREDYRLPGPEFGRLFLCDPESLEPVSWIWGRNQPTGLDISPDGELIAFTDFMDNNLELYELIPSSRRAARKESLR